MQEYIKIISNSSLFHNIDIKEINHFLNTTNPTIINYKKNETILSYGQITNSLGLILKGQLLIYKEDYWGNRNILAIFNPKEIFAETFASANMPLNVQVEANSDCIILWIPVKTINNNINLYNNLLQNMAIKNIYLNEKLILLGQRTTRQKLLAYFSSIALKNNNNEFDIPFNRQQLADYLLIERSGCSLELSKMQKEGLIEYHKNHFIIKKKAE